ncbi:MAG: dUTP diphosphatase [Butyrivibrio sp.]|nr:dUTP diphosphatase [Butyrivibrio sp.]
MEIRIKKLTQTAQIPMRGSEYAAGYDLYADIQENVCVAPHTSVKIPTGLALEIPEGYFGAVYARSGLACKESLRPANCVGVIDADYRGPVMVVLHNDSEQAREITPGERVAQLVIMPFLPVLFKEVDDLTQTIRGEDGFGSTGKN